MKTKQQLKSCIIGALCFIGSISSVSAAIIINPSLTITELVTIQPIVVSDNDGSNTAEFFGTSGQQSTI